MKYQLSLAPRITLAFVLFAAALLAGVGWLSYENGRTALQASATSELLSAAIEKETALNGWVDERLADLSALAESPTVRGDVSRLVAAPTASARRSSHEHLKANLQPSVGPHYMELFVLHPASGKVLLSTRAAEEGKSKKNDAYFVNGKIGSYVKNPYLSDTLGAAALAMSTPVRSAAGRLVGVLVARLDLHALDAIVRQRSGLRRTDDAYVFNPDRKFVTQPRFIAEPAVLDRLVHSEAVTRCLKRSSGVLTAPDYRGTRAIVVYRWMPARQLGLILKMDEAEALAPAYAFGRTIVLISVLALLLASGLAFGLARGISRPIRTLQHGVARFGQGELDARLPENTMDEVGLLAREFNEMAVVISSKEAQLREQSAQLEQRVQERTAQLEVANREVEEAGRANRNMMEYSQDVICSIGEDGRFISVSPACREVWGYSPEELAGRPFIDLVHPEDASKTREKDADIVEGNATKSFENRYVRRDGSTVHMLWSAVWSETEKSMFCVARDITERKRAEEELHAAKVAAEEASLAKSQFLANMSHEIRTPMNGVLGPVGLLLDSKLTSQQRELTEITRSSAEALLGIINDILDLSKIEVGKLEIEPIPFNLLLAIEETAAMMVSNAEAKGVDLIVRYPAAVPRYVIGDPGRIRQVLTNLISNAIKFTSEGHVLINIEAQEQSSEDVTLRVAVEDTGIGIEPDKLEHVFGRFNQADTSTTRRYGGTGLGLAISRQLVDLMGGEIGAASTPGEGSTFSFTLRLPLQIDAPTVSLPDVDLSGARILIVDDNAVNRRVLHEQLNNWNLPNESASASEEALEMLRLAHTQGQPFQIAILDHQMPDMDGEMLGRAIKADEMLCDTILVMLTSLGHKGDSIRLKAAGFAEYLLKPARQSELLSTLVNVWAARNAAQGAELATRGNIAPVPVTLQSGGESWTGTRVLVAEDNIVNQKVATMMLRSLGCCVEVAANGREAVQMLDGLPFDIVFMDCEMPEMDGYEATAEVRRRVGSMSHLPIIAVTAKATQGDRDYCLQAGMDDYISKPVQTEDFRAALEHWAPRTQDEDTQRESKSAVVALSPEKQSAADDRPVLDVEVVARLRDLAAATDASLLGQIFGAFAVDGEKRLLALQSASKESDASALRNAAHALKGASANIGAQTMAAIAQELQALGEAASVEGAGPLITQLQAEFIAVRTAIAAELEKP